MKTLEIPEEEPDGLVERTRHPAGWRPRWSGNQPDCLTELDWWTWGENIAAGYASPEAVMSGWMNRSGHRANILNCNYTEIGVGYAYVADDPGTVQYHPTGRKCLLSRGRERLLLKAAAHCRGGEPGRTRGHCQGVRRRLCETLSGRVPRDAGLRLYFGHAYAFEQVCWIGLAVPGRFKKRWQRRWNLVAGRPVHGRCMAMSQRFCWRSIKTAS